MFFLCDLNIQQEDRTVFVSGEAKAREVLQRLTFLACSGRREKEVVVLVGEVVMALLLLLLPVELLVGGEEQLSPLLAVAAVSQQLDAVGLDVLLHVVPLDKAPKKRNNVSQISQEKVTKLVKL